ncbi:GDSL-like Lipase/Acylhydrolase family protein [Oribacterium sp. KHPX15]|uniref:GDSL-type esterase/lipase family protein n=1 Tax=Oribacterium sp. KHPX15 TaxID=1855342 RepID=UPI00089A3AD5|nr:GDSL-type esterase/lipase family protein [Oribacterium sp. KHPX15]SEA46205.1 GDSL-like Lipase/Acylhydrolase family protein [Oribacterium sp. KHPX15]
MKKVRLYIAGISAVLSLSMTVPVWAGVAGYGIDVSNMESNMMGPGPMAGETTGTVVNEVSGTASGDTTGTAASEAAGTASGETPGAAASEAAGTVSGETPGAAVNEIAGTAVNIANSVSEKWAQRDVAYLTNDEIEALRNYFQGSVIIGDSVAENFQRYNMAGGAGDVVSDSFTSLGVAGYSIANALLPNDGKNIHPMIQGKRYRLPEAIGMIGAKHVYSFFGYKDLADPNAANNYEILLKEIQAANPGIDINVISTTYMTAAYQKTGYNNDSVRMLNAAMKQKCAENGWTFIDVQEIMSDGNGNLPDSWSIDQKIHYNYQYYIYWINEMKRAALTKLGL